MDLKPSSFVFDGTARTQASVRSPHSAIDMR
jgi:hypothetical protein